MRRLVTMRRLVITGTSMYRELRQLSLFVQFVRVFNSLVMVSFFRSLGNVSRLQVFQKALNLFVVCSDLVCRSFVETQYGYSDQICWSFVETLSKERINK
jgi:hypothetical protein